MSEGSEAAPRWRIEIEALEFQLRGHGGTCMVHRHAFRTLLGRMPSPGDCIAFFAAHAPAFQAAATAKIARANVAADANLHLNSRDVARAMAKLVVASLGQSG